VSSRLFSPTVVTNRDVRRARWEHIFYGAWEEGYTLYVRGPHPRRMLAGVKRKRRDQGWVAWIETPLGDRSLGYFAGRGRAKRLCRTIVRSLRPEQRGRV
jgi:hypothetical protein